MTETLSLEFKKDNGKKFTMALPYAKKPVEQADVKTLVQHIARATHKSRLFAKNF